VIAVPYRPGLPALRIGARALTVAGAYVATALVVLMVVLLLRRQIDPAPLRDALSFLFIAALAAGLEPGTVKAAMLRGAKGDRASAIGARAFLAVSALKGVLAAPLLAIVWRVADPHLEVRALIWTPFVAVAGFAATDLRVLYDVRGRHALAIWLKQGSLSGGLVVLAGLLWAGMPLFWAMGVSTIPRLALVLCAALREPRPARATPLSRQVRWLLGDIRWLELAGASAIAAVGGSADRVLALRYLAPTAYAAYYLLYEAFSRFWLLPYLLTPIVFARRAAGQAADALVRGAWLTTLVAGIAFVGAVGLAQAIAPEAVARLLGARFGAPLLAFAAAVVLNSFSQLRVADLQGSGATGRTAIVTGAVAAVSLCVFFVAVQTFGPTGLLMAWLIKSGLELAAVLAIRPGR
jgi:hypothetical protein